MDSLSLLDHPFHTPGGITSPREYFNRLFSSEFDFEKYSARGGMLEAILSLSENRILHSEDMFCSGSLAYWEIRGLRKSYIRDDSGDYILFTPLSMEKPENANRKYPLIFTICGFNDEIDLVETLGFTHLAAEEELIQVVPLIFDPNREPALDRDRPYTLLDRLKKDLPVDETRIYMTGFSHGGILSQWNGIAHIDCFAGAAAAGIRPGDGAPRRIQLPGFFYYDYPVDERRKKLHLPIVFCIGMAEQPEHIPLYHENTAPVFEHYLDEHVMHLRYITRLNEISDLDESDLLACRDSPNDSERVLGLPLVNTKTGRYFGVNHYFGDLASSDGVCRTRFIAVENQPHHPSAAWARLSWDFLKHFTRNPLTGESVYNP